MGGCKSEVVNVIYYVAVPYPDARTTFLRDKATTGGATWKVHPSIPQQLINAFTRELIQSSYGTIKYHSLLNNRFDLITEQLTELEALNNVSYKY